MDSDLIICPVCGESVPYARRCRKCAASLASIPEPPPPSDAWDGSEKTRYRLTLASKPLSKNEGAHLKIADRSGRMTEKIIVLPKGLDHTPVRWQIASRGTRQFFSAFFYINGAGHDLDMWLHYDLETGQFLAMRPGAENDTDPASVLK